MQTIKDLLNPGGKETDQLLYGQKDNLEGETFNAGKNTTSAGPGTGSVGAAGTSGANTHNLTGTATGLDNTTAGAGGISQRDYATTTTGPHSSNLANRADPRVDTHQDTTRQTTGSGLTQNPTTHQDITGLAQGNTATQSPSATAPSNPYSSKQVDPRLGGSNTQATSFPASSTGQTGSGYGNPTSIEDNTRVPGGNADRLSDPANTRNTSGSGHHLGRDTAVLGTGAAVGEGVHHHRENERNLAGSNHDHPAGNNTTSTSGVHSSNLANKADPRIDSDRDGSRILGSNSNTGAYHTNPSTAGTTSTNTGSGHHYGRDAAVLGTGAAVGEGIHHHGENERNLGSSTARDNVGNTSSNYSATTNNPISGDSNTSGSGFTGTSTGTGHHGHEQGHSHSHGTEAAAGGAAAAALAGSRHDTSTKYSGTTPSGMSSSYYGGPKGTAVDGPHATSTANRLDPHISDNKHLPPIEDATTHHPETGGGSESADLAHQDKSKLTGSQNATSKEQYLGDTGPAGKDHHYGRDAGLAGVAAAGTGYETKKHHDNKHDVSGTSGVPNTTSTKDAAFGSSDLHGRHEGTSGLLGTSGVPTSTGTNNQGLTGTSHNTTGTPSNYPTSTGNDHKYGRDAALGTGAGVAGHEAKKHHDNTTTSGASPTNLGKDHHDKHNAGLDTGASSVDLGHTPHNSKILNVLDPRVKTVGIGATKEAKEAEALRTKNNESGTGQGSHLARDGAGVAAAGGVGYEAEKHHKKHESPISDSTATSGKDHHHGMTSNTGKDHHVARDVGGAGLVGGAGYEAEKAHHSHQTDANKSLPSTTGNHGVGTGAGTQSAVGVHTHDTTTSSRTPNVDRYYGRDAAVGGAGLGGAAALGEHEHNKHAHVRSTDDEFEKSQHLGDHLHGVERNRGVPDSSVMSSTSTGANDKYNAHEHGTHSSGDHERNRLHKNPPASHPASGVTGAGTSHNDSPSGYGRTSSGTPYDSLQEGENYGASTGTYSYGDQRAMPRSELNAAKSPMNPQHAVDGGVPGGKDARHGLVEQGQRNLDGQTGVSNAGESVGRKL